MTDLIRLFAGPSRFPLGRCLLDRALSDAIADDEVLAKHVIAAMRRHARADWGDVDADDKRANDYDLHHGGRLLSAYRLPDRIRGRYRDEKVWIITEADRAATTALWPSDY